MTLTYALLAGLWIVGSDVAMAWRHDEPTDDMWWNIGKGLLFVGVTSLVLYQLSLGLVRRVGEVEAEQRRVEREAASALERSNRLYATLAQANEAALTATTRGELCRAMCRTLVERAGMRLAWIGWVNESTQWVEVEAWEGPASAYTENLAISADPLRPESRGPSGQSIIQKRAFVCPDIQHSPLMAPWRERAACHELRSSVAVPLFLADGSRGTLTIYSGETGFFTPEIISLVEKLATDLVHGLEVQTVRHNFQQQAAALRESERRWQYALEGAGDGVWDLNLVSGEAFFSPRLARMFGYDPEEFHGRFAEWKSHIHPEDLARAQADFEDCLSGRTPLLHSEYRLRCKDGSYRWVLDRGKVVERDAAGKPTRAIGTFADVTELRRTNQRLALLETALQAMPTGIVITDQQGRIEWVNDGFTRLTGYDKAEALGQNPRVLRSGRHPDEFYAGLWQTILRGEVWSGDLVNRRKDGTEYHEHMIIAPVSHGSSGITHFIAIKQDITEHRQIEQQLLRAQRMEGIGLLAGGIAHDLNNVLAPILLSVELLRMRCREEPDRRTLDVIEAAARRGSGVVRQVLTFARGIDGERTPLRPRDLIRELVMIIEETFPRDIEIRREVADDTPMVRGDTTQLHQVLLNLAVNARDAMPDGGRLIFGTSLLQVGPGRTMFGKAIKPGRYVVMSVKDTGQGMAPEVRERIFEPFFTTKPRGKGTGLGLPTVLGIVRSHEGFIEVNSEPGKGSEFRVCLPAMPDEESAPEARATAVSLAGAGRTILVCDDESAVREIASVILVQAGFKIVEAANGREALSIFAERGASIDGVLMDIMMPLMTGDRAVAEMLQMRPELPVLFMSGLMDHEAVQVALKKVGTPAIPLLKKPFAASDLLTMLSLVIEPRGGGTRAGAEK